MSIESGARPYVRVAGTGKPELIQSTPATPSASTPSSTSVPTFLQQEKTRIDTKVSPVFIQPSSQPTPIKEEPTYQTINKELSTTKAQVILSKLPAKEKIQMVRQITEQQKQIKQYESQGFIAEKVRVSGELKPGEMGPPAPVDVYQFKAPEDIQLRWAKYQTEQASKLPPVLKEVAEFGQGIVSSGLSVVAPVADVFGKRKEFDLAASIAMAKGTAINPFDTKQFSKQLSGSIKSGEYGIHYPSALDVVMEPVGWSPKGSTEFLKQHPIFAAGSVAGEIPQWIAGGEIIKATGKVAKAGMKFIVPRATSIFSKVTPVIERTVGKTVPSFAKRLSETTIGKNVMLFGKGYEPVSKGVQRVVSSQSSRVVDGATTVTKITREFKIVPQKWYGFAEREFIPRASSKTVLKPSKEITMIMRPAEKESSIIFESTGYKSGLKGTFRTYQSVDVVSRYGKTYIESGLLPTKGSLYNVQRGIKPLTESELALWHPKVNWLYTKVIPSQQGLGIPFIAKQTVRKSTEASASLLRPPAAITKFISTSGRTTINVPTGILTNIPVSGIEKQIGQIGIYGVSKIPSHEMKQYNPMLPVVMPVQERETGVRAFPVSSQVPAIGQVEMQMPVQRPMTGQDIISRQITAQEQRQDLTSIEQSIMRSKVNKITERVYRPPVPFPVLGFGGGESKASGGSRQHKARWKKGFLHDLPIPTLKDLFGGMKT